MTEQAGQTALRARRAGDRATLFWSEHGEICCATHAPYPGTDTWNWERWSRMTEAEEREWTSMLGSAPRCEVCTHTQED